MRECKKQEIDSLPAKKVNEKRALQKSGREKEQNKGAVIAAKNGTKGNDERGDERNGDDKKRDKMRTKQLSRMVDKRA